MPPYDEGAPAAEALPKTPLEELQEEFEWEQEEPGEPRKFRKVNYERLKVVPLPALEKMQMLIDECEKYLSLPLGKDKYGVDHEARQNAWAEAATRYPQETIVEFREGNRIKINKMFNAQILARHVCGALDTIEPFPEELKPLREIVEKLRNAFDRPADSEVAFGDAYNRWSTDKKMDFVKGYSANLRAYLNAVT